jgi:hypothetical protein
MMSSAVDGAEQRPFRAAAVAMALGIAIGLSPRLRRTALLVIRKALGTGV